MVQTSQYEYDWEPFPSPQGRYEAYQRDGVVVARSVFDASEITHIRQVFIKELEQNRQKMSHDDKVPSNDPLAKYPRFVHPHRHPETQAGQLARQNMVNKRILDIVQTLVGPAYGAQSMFYFKPPTARGQALHQDNMSLRAHPETCIAAWIAVDDADGENGGLMVVPGSHKHETICPTPADPTLSFSNSEVKLPPGMKRFQTKLKAGDVLFFHGSLVHGSNPNRSDSRFRRALIFHYVPQSSKEIAFFYLPLIRPDGTEEKIEEAELGGPCGNPWQEEA
ncbi:phytanoyl-CoA dioxygenase family protein [Naematelia encephala]|uniref:Phytanoyl-CoA dioxygenase family protein n=1 Tax=Naematelia encephala TaxID=71784 RepID=A0A1Y2AQ87_9TREE|nr:phytanoyl-CoA dioxygenase family protein [Naematelia encephala]